MAGPQPRTRASCVHACRHASHLLASPGCRAATLGYRSSALLSSSPPTHTHIPLCVYQTLQKEERQEKREDEDDGGGWGGGDE